MAGLHGPGRAVQCRDEIVVTAELGGARADTHANRQFQPPLGVDGGTCRAVNLSICTAPDVQPECRDDPVAGMFEQPPAVAFDGIGNDLVVQPPLPT